MTNSVATLSKRKSNRHRFFNVDLSKLAISVVGLLSATISYQALASGSSSELPSEPTPYLSDAELPERTAPLLELGQDFLGTGNISPGFTIPTGAVWQPSLWVYGNFRSAVQYYEAKSDGKDRSEWMNRLDLFANLQLTGTERVLLGLTPLHKDNEFSGYTRKLEADRGSVENYNHRVRTFFFEGDLAEIFPRWDSTDSMANDVGISLGRQNVIFQNGMFINDMLDGVGFSKNNINFTNIPSIVNIRSSFFYAWNEVHREDNQDDNDADLYALMTQIDTTTSTINIDFAYVDADELTGNLFVSSIDATQRIGKVNTTFRIANSHTDDDETTQSSTGTLLFSEVSWTPAHSNNLAYINTFAAIDNYTSAARDSLAGGPLGRVGLLYAASGIGTYPSPLSNRANEAYGFSMGYQFISADWRRQFIVEIGARNSDANNEDRQYGIACRFQQAIGRRLIVQLDGFIVEDRVFGSNHGTRAEIQVKF